MAGCQFVECFAPQLLALSIGVIAVTERCSQPVVGSRKQLAVRLSVKWVVGGRHWTRTSDLLHVKRFRLSAVLGA